MAGFWMVRAGEQGYLFDDFVKANAVAIGFAGDVDLTPAKTKADVRTLVLKTRPSTGTNGMAVLMKFRCTLAVGDGVITYNPLTRQYLIGKIIGDYAFKAGVVKDHAHFRSVAWRQPISRDALSPPRIKVEVKHRPRTPIGAPEIRSFIGGL